MVEYLKNMDRQKATLGKKSMSKSIDSGARILEFQF